MRFYEEKIMNKEIEKMASILGNGCTIPCSKCRFANDCGELEGAIKFYEQGYRKQSEEDLIDKIATYFEQDKNWTRLKDVRNWNGRSDDLRRMLKESLNQ